MAGEAQTMTLIILSVTTLIITITTGFLAYNQFLMVREIERIKKDLYYLRRDVEALTRTPW
jgi:hypothetical protein